MRHTDIAIVMSSTKIRQRRRALFTRVARLVNFIKITKVTVRRGSPWNLCYFGCLVGFLAIVDAPGGHGVQLQAITILTGHRNRRRRKKKEKKQKRKREKNKKEKSDAFGHLPAAGVEHLLSVYLVMQRRQHPQRSIVCSGRLAKVRNGRKKKRWNLKAVALKRPTH